MAPYGGEVLGLLTAAVHAEIPVETLRGMHFAYPTFHRAIAAALATSDASDRLGLARVTAGISGKDLREPGRTWL